jgi:putative Flp pilus-assembly TadE/G-like protein
MEEPRKPRRASEDGVAILYVAVFLLSSLWLVSLAIDMGKLMAARTELQSAADAAALAGASAVDPETGIVVADTARVRAAETAALNKAYEQNQTPVTIDPITDVNFPAGNQVRVQVHREEATGNPVITHFAQTLGIDALNVTADATAEAQPLTEVCEHLAPFAPIQTPNGQPFSNDCDSTYWLKVPAGKSQQGNFQLLDFPPCDEGPCAGAGGGANAVRCYTLHGYGCCLGIGTEFVYTEPGNKVGPLRDALQERWDADTDKSSNCYQDYAGNDSRVFIVPIVDTFDVNGKKLVRVTGFAAFFLINRPQGGGQGNFAKGQFIKYVAPGNAGPNPPPNAQIYGVHLVE